jgi:hypothetical protein
MKKLIPFLILGVLILSSIGAVATINKQPESEPAKIVEIYVQGGCPTISIRIEVGNEPHCEGGTFELTIDAPIMLFGQKSIIKLPDWLPAHQAVSIPFGGHFGFGRCSIQVTFDVDDDGEPDTEGTRQGFIFGPLVFFPYFYIPIP